MSRAKRFAVIGMVFGGASFAIQQAKSISEPVHQALIGIPLACATVSFACYAIACALWMEER